MNKGNYSDQVPVVYGKYFIDIEYLELRMSLWVAVFSIENALTKEVILSFKQSLFHFLAVKELNNGIVITFQIYPDGQKSYEMHLNFDLQQIELLGKIYTFDEYKKSFIKE